MGPLAADGRRCHISLGDALLRSNSGFGCPAQQADVLRRWAQQHRPRRRHSHGAGLWCSAREGSNAAVLERPNTAEAPARFTQTQREGPTERQAGDAAAGMHAPQQLLVLAPKPRARPHAPRAPKRSLALEGSAALTSLMLARALGTTVEQVTATRCCCAEVSYTAAPNRAQWTAQQALQAVCWLTIFCGAGTRTPAALGAMLAGKKAQPLGVNSRRVVTVLLRVNKTKLKQVHKLLPLCRAWCCYA